jgi:tetratricopeptide (TPR) repeat protein
MRRQKRSSILAAALAAAAIPAQAGFGSDQAPPAPATAAECATAPAGGAAEAPAPAAAPDPVLVDGLGYAGIVPDTQSAEARRWFEQGVRLIWAYDEAEAVRSFAQAQKLDPSCAMCAWGEAWARGPTLNLQPRTEEHGAASKAAARAHSLAGSLGERDRALVEAMRVRVGGAGGGAFDDKGYARAMARVAKRFPLDDAALVMAADSQIILGARKGKLKPGSAAQTWLETVLKRQPAHSGAIHLYIHLTDFVELQKLAEPHAERLGRLAPAASHLVHMPSHTFYGVGRYKDAAAVNLAAMAADRSYAARVKPPSSDYRTALYAHNNHFAIESALMRGDGRTALEMADHFRERYPEKTSPRPLIRAATWYAYGLHADVADVLAMEEPREGPALLRAVRRYARGEALARKGDSAGVRAEARAIAAFLAGPDGRALGSKPVEALVTVAQKVLEGRAAMIGGRFAEAAAAYRQAMILQGKAGFGMDPPPFWYSTRRSLGAAMLAGGDPAGARLQFIATLKDWPNDPLALYGLAKAEQALGRTDLAERHLASAQRGWAGNLELVPLARI